MSTYIKGAACISTQATLDESLFLHGPASAQSDRMRCIEPDYSQWVDSKQIRRMSRVIKMGVGASIMALQDAGLEQPEAIIAGTSLGCLEDTGSFLTKLVANKEEFLNPTAFIHSTHNTIAGQIALFFGCRGYNSTYAHRGTSFEAALLDAQLLIEEARYNNVLIGGIDELTDTSFAILQRFHAFGTAKCSAAGEGSGYFVLTNEKDDHAYAELAAVDLFSGGDMQRIVGRAKSLLEQHNCTADWLITGASGEQNEETEHYTHFAEGLGLSGKSTSYKSICGEYGTSAAFATWLAANMIKRGALPHWLGIAADPKCILLYHRQKNNHHTLILLKAC